MLQGWLKKLMDKGDSKDVAKKRLQFALIYDKLEVSDDILIRLHQDIVDVISLYFEIDKETLKIDIRKSEGKSALVVNTPILSAKRLRPV
jgi:cell division topological specificity factor